MLIWKCAILVLLGHWSEQLYNAMIIFSMDEWQFARTEHIITFSTAKVIWVFFSYALCKRVLACLICTFERPLVTLLGSTHTKKRHVFWKHSSKKAFLLTACACVFEFKPLRLWQVPDTLLKWRYSFIDWITRSTVFHEHVHSLTPQAGLPF